MLQQLQIIDNLITQVKKVLPIREEYQRNLDKKIRLEFSYNSNHLEGNTLTYGETELLLIFGKTQGQHELREYEEMEAHDVAFKIIKEWAADTERPLTEVAIKNLNETLLVKPYWKDAATPDGQPTRRQIKVGDYKEYPNHVQLQNGEIFYYASPADTPIQMGELIDWYRSEEEKKELHPVALAALLHYRFVRIHPFDDGNGRISRLLMNYVLLKHQLPPVVIKSSDKKNYLFALNRADTGDTEAFINYIAEQLIWSLQLCMKAANGESLDKPGDLDKKLFLLKKKVGQDVDAKVELKYGEEAINFVIHNVIYPLTKKWEEYLKKFEIFFNTRESIIAYNGFVFPVQKFDNSIPDDVKKIYAISSRINNLKEIQLLIVYIGMRTKSNYQRISAGQFSISFFGNAYELTYSGGKNNLNNLYNKSLTEEEITTITESLGSWFYSQIEQALAE